MIRGCNSEMRLKSRCGWNAVRFFAQAAACSALVLLSNCRFGDGAAFWNGNEYYDDELNTALLWNPDSLLLIHNVNNTSASEVPAGTRFSYIDIASGSYFSGVVDTATSDSPQTVSGRLVWFSGRATSLRKNFALDATNLCARFWFVRQASCDTQCGNIDNWASLSYAAPLQGSGDRNSSDSYVWGTWITKADSTFTTCIEKSEAAPGGGYTCATPWIKKTQLNYTNQVFKQVIHETLRADLGIPELYAQNFCGLTVKK